MMAAGAGPEVATRPPIARTIAPDPALKDAFDAGHAAYARWRNAVGGADARPTRS